MVVDHFSHNFHPIGIFFQKCHAWNYQSLWGQQCLNLLWESAPSHKWLQPGALWFKEFVWLVETLEVVRKSSLKLKALGPCKHYLTSLLFWKTVTNCSSYLKLNKIRYLVFCALSPGALFCVFFICKKTFLLSWVRTRVHVFISPVRAFGDGRSGQGEWKQTEKHQL